MRTSVVIVEDQPRLREALVALLGGMPGFAVAGAFGAMEPALAALAGSPADVALIDLGLPGMSGIEGVRRLRQIAPATQVLVLTVHDDDVHVFEAICAGACGYLLKDTPPARIVAAIEELRAGGAPMSPAVARRVVSTFHRVAPREAATILSPRERDVLAALAAGSSYKEVAASLGLAIDTVRFHVRHIYEKLHVHSKSAAVMRAFQRGLLS
jgi:DNA-binding NarL/FixJ family response regulator